MNTISSGTIPGSAGKKKIYYKFLRFEPESTHFFIFFHGSFSSSYFGEKNDIIARKIIENGLGNVLLYETSRQVYSFETKLPFEEYKKAFGPKTYREELEDVKSIFSFFNQTMVKDRSRSRFHFVGSSLGGTQCSYLLPEYGHMVSDVFLLGSGITTKTKGSTYPGYPAKEEILKNYHDYSGAVYLVQGSEDTVVSKEEAMELLDHAGKSRVKMNIIMEGVDHSFRKLNGQPAIPQVADMIYSVLETHADLDGGGGRDATVAA